MPQVVLVGAGHTHIQVLRHWTMYPDPEVEATLVVDTPIAVYSGMAPGLVAGQYRGHELEIDAVPLARRAGVRVVLAACTGVEAAGRRVLLDGRAPLHFEIASFDVGSTVAGTSLPGVREHAVPTRPINRLAASIDDRIRRLTGRRPRVVVVGSGAGGIELAFCIEARLRGPEPGGPGADESAEGCRAAAEPERHRPAAGIGQRAPVVTIVEAGGRILPGQAPALVRRIEAEARARGIATLTDAQVTAVDSEGVELRGGERLASDLTLWVTGAAPLPIFRGSDLPLCERGFLRTRSTLQVDGHDHIFAVGDCATLVDQPDRPRAGVYAVRMGPSLIDNLERLTSGRALRPYRPQSDFLSLLNLGDGRAVGTKRGFVFGGRWAMRLKDRIDRRFMTLFQTLDAEGTPLPTFPAMNIPVPDAHTTGRGGDPGGAARPSRSAAPAMTASAGGDEAPMYCGGCAAKVGPDRLGRALARAGLTGPSTGRTRPPDVLLDAATPDDAAAWRTPAGERVVSSLDAFPAFTDDPWLVGRVAAVNACSDLHATGVAPRFALALITLPHAATGEDAEQLLVQVLAGARNALDEERVHLLGGHTTTGPELVVGFHVEGVAEEGEELLLKGRVRAGDQLVLTAPLGTGVLLAADRMGLCPGRWLRSCLTSMQTSNRAALDAARCSGLAAATDVSGFGLAGHVAEMASASNLAVHVFVDALPALPGALELLGRGLRSTSHDQNRQLPTPVRRQTGPGPRVELAFDPQTAGGLVLAAPPQRVGELIDVLRARGCRHAAVIGEARAAGAPGPALTLASAPVGPGREG